MARCAVGVRLWSQAGSLTESLVACVHVRGLRVCGKSRFLRISGRVVISLPSRCRLSFLEPSMLKRSDSSLPTQVGRFSRRIYTHTHINTPTCTKISKKKEDLIVFLIFLDVFGLGFRTDSSSSFRISIC